MDRLDGAFEVKVCKGVIRAAEERLKTVEEMKQRVGAVFDAEMAVLSRVIERNRQTIEEMDRKGGEGCE